jgi:hypothetical protein
MLRTQSCSGGCRSALKSFLRCVFIPRHGHHWCGRRTIRSGSRLLGFLIGLRDKQRGGGNQGGKKNERGSAQRKFGFFHEIMRGRPKLYSPEN